MGKDRTYSSYGTGYDPKAVEHDLKLISWLMHGKRQLTMQLAQEIYYKIKNENLAFQSDTGKDFLDKLQKNMTAVQMQEIDRIVRRKKLRKQNRKRLLRINRRIAVAMSAMALVLSVVFLNWSLLMDLRTNYQAKKLQARINAQEIAVKAEGVAGADAEKEAGQKINENAEQNMPVPENQNAVSLSAHNGSDLSGAVKTEVMGKFTELYKENPDFAGWLRIPGTKIDYPVMSRNGDNNYYLDKNFEQQPDKNGLLVLDYRSDVTAGQEDLQNLIIYGHNMRTGVMFGTLKNYKDKAFCAEHMMIRFDTLYEECEYRVVAAMLAEVEYEDEDVFRYYDAIDISTEENFNAFQENIMSNALYVTDETIAYGDTCLILSTCDNYKEDGRFVVIAKKTERE